MSLVDSLPARGELKRKVDSIFIHCSDTPAGMDIGRDEIDQWHKERGWSGIGYHFVVRRDGTVELGRDVQIKGAHAKGHNARSIGVCIVGRGQYANHQELKMFQLVALLCERYGLKVGQVIGHHEVDPGKECPMMNMGTVRSMLRSMGVEV